MDDELTDHGDSSLQGEGVLNSLDVKGELKSMDCTGVDSK
jgi:hypothetical protein